MAVSPKKSTENQRLDVALTKNGLASSRERAQAYILAGRVRVNGQTTTKASQKVSASCALSLSPPKSLYASRGGEKLALALEGFGISPKGLRVLDVGASHGGFTDCLLQKGAHEVVALDVGYGQLSWALRQDPRVVVFERKNMRHTTPEELGESFPLMVVDVSFISLTKLMPSMAACLKEGGQLLALVKPQFEAGREALNKRGWVDSEKVHEPVLQKVVSSAKLYGLEYLGERSSGLLGKKSGNQEFFALFKKAEEKNTLLQKA